MTEPRQPNDALEAALLSQVAVGSENAFVELYRRRHEDVFRFAFAMSKSASIAQDVTQDVFLDVLQNATRFDPAKGSVRAWLCGCARHIVLDRLRRDARLTDELPEEASVACAGEDEIYKEQRLGRLHAAIVDLPVEYREAIVLCELAELSYAETAAVLSCPIGTVRSRLHRAKALLATRLGTAATQAAAEPPRAEPAAGAPLLKAREVCS